MTILFIIGYLRITIGEFPHSEICGYNGCLRLTAAYRSLPRPSSAPSAKASALCSFSLDQKCLRHHAFDDGFFNYYSLKTLSELVFSGFSVLTFYINYGIAI